MNTTNVTQSWVFRNTILASLPVDERLALQPHLSRVRLISGQILHEPGERIANVFFIEHGLASVMALTDDRRERLEIGLIGRDGMTGLQAVLGPDASTYNSIMVQAAGDAHRLPASVYHDVTRRTPVLRRLLFQALEIFIAQISQTAVCYRQHVLSQRLAKWLLAARDRASKDELPLTQEFLAMMLGVQRPSVTIAVEALHKAGLIRSSRGHIIIEDRGGLELAACPCYVRLQTFTSSVVERQLVPS